MSMSSPQAADRNLLFGILALQMDFVKRDALLAAMQAWVFNKTTSLGQILREQNVIGAEEEELLEALVRKHLQRHNNDPEKSLAAVTPAVSVKEELERIDDPQLQATLAGLASYSDPEATRADRVYTADAAPAVARYRILRRHARGGLGEIFVALDEELHREVALKEMQEHHARDSVSRGRFLLEAEITGALEHPGIVPVYGMGQYRDGRPFYAMRFIKGDNLKSAIEHFHEADAPGRDTGERRLAFCQLLRRFLDVCNVIAYAHSRGVLHRDLKPGNIMLGKYGETLVIDWGLAKSVGRPEVGTIADERSLSPSSSSELAATEMGTTIGTPGYMSPEQAAGRLELVGPASDIYSLGATLYTLLAGRPPFTDRDSLDVLEKVQRGDFLPPGKIKASTPPPLEAICLKAMALRAEDRYASPHALAQDIEHWLADEPVPVYPDPLSSRVARWARRHKAAVTGAAALLVTAVVGLTLGILAVNQERRRTALVNTDLAAEQARTQAALEAEARRREQARAALDAMSSQVVEDWLAQQKSKDLTDAQKKFLRQALESYEAFSRDTGQEEKSRAGVAAASRRVGDIRYKLGQASEAEQAYRRSVDHYARLAADFPETPEYRHGLAMSQNDLGALLYVNGRVEDAESTWRNALTISKGLAGTVRDLPESRLTLARTYNRLGILLEETSRPKEAESAYRSALVIQQKLVADFATVPEHRDELARLHNNLGIVLKRTDRPKEAERAYRDAIAARQQLVTDYPTAPGYRRSLAATRSNLGNLFMETGRLKEAESCYRDALAIERQLAADFPSAPIYRHALSLSHYNVGEVTQKTNRPKEAESAYHDALAIQKQLVVDFPDVPNYHNDLAGTLVNLGDLLRQSRDYPGARRLYEAALPHHQAALKANPRDPDYHEYWCNNRAGLSETLLVVGDHAGAALAAGQLIEAGADRPNDLYKAGRLLARCVGRPKRILGFRQPSAWS